jgi:uncharacterized protein (DUF433 family)
MMGMDRSAEVPNSEYPHIVADEMFEGEPCIRERRITILDVYEQIQEGNGEMTRMNSLRHFGSMWPTYTTRLRTITPTSRKWHDIVMNTNRLARNFVSASSTIGQRISISGDERMLP